MHTVNIVERYNCSGTVFVIQGSVYATYFNSLEEAIEKCSGIYNIGEIILKDPEEKRAMIWHNRNVLKVVNHTPCN